MKFVRCVSIMLLAFSAMGCMQLDNVPGEDTGYSNETSLNVEVTGTNLVEAQYKVGMAVDVDCVSNDDYSNPIPVPVTIVDDISALSEGEVTLCVYGKFETPTSRYTLRRTETWIKDTVPPGTFEITGPGGVIDTQTPAISWEVSPGASSYDLTIAHDSACTLVEMTVNDLTGTVHNVGAALLDGPYYTCVTAKDQAGNTVEAANTGLAFTIDTGSPLREPYDGMSITADVQLVPGTYELPNGISIDADGVSVECLGTILIGSGVGSGIRINGENTSVVKCRIEDYQHGILLQSHRHNKVIGNTLINNSLKVHAEDADLFQGNMITNPSEAGFEISQVANSLFFANSVRDSQTGFWLGGDSVQYNEFSNNYVENNIYGFYLGSGVNDNLFLQNKVSKLSLPGQTVYGFYHGAPDGASTLNEFATNTVKNNDYGLYLSQCSDINIADNYVAGNDYGVYLTQSSGSYAYLNTIAGNVAQEAYDDSGANFWDENEEGNFWGDYNQLSEGCVDSDWDWLCDDPKVIPPSAQDESAWSYDEDYFCPAMDDFGGVYEVRWCCQLRQIQDDLAANYQLVSDIYCSETVMWNDGLGFEPLGPFAGELEGDDYYIIGLVINRPSEDGVGLFSSIATGGIVRNVYLSAVHVAGGASVGALTGLNQGSVSNCSVSGSVSGSGSAVGSMVGLNQGTVSSSTSYGTVTAAGEDVGGLVGRNAGTIQQGYARVDVSGLQNLVGGLAGSNQEDGTIEDSDASGSVAGINQIGGLVGTNYSNGSISNSFATGRISGAARIGGLLGYNLGGTVLNDSYASGDVSGRDAVGGLVGENDETATISSSYYNHHDRNPEVCVGVANGVIDCTRVDL